MPCDYRKYPTNWAAIRQHIMERAKGMCELCGVDHHAVGYRDQHGHFRRAGGNIFMDHAGLGMDYPSGGRLTYSEAAEVAEAQNCCIGKRGCDDDGNHWFVIVLTVAHLDHDVTNNADSNLMALCQRCHNRHDAKHRSRNASETRVGKKDALAGQRRIWC